MKETIVAKWLNDLSFEVELDGHKIYLDTSPEHGGKNLGPRPKPLLMVSLAGCTAMDVVSILKKMRVEPDDLKVHIEGDLTEEHPKQFTKMHIIYEFFGKDLPMDKLEKAINLSQERYCGVSASYKKVMEISHEIVVKD